MLDLVRVAGVRQLVAVVDAWVERGVLSTLGLWRLRGDRVVRLQSVGLPAEWRPPARPADPWSRLEAEGRAEAPGLPGCSIHLLRRGAEVSGLGVFPDTLDRELIAGVGETLGRCLDADEALVRAKLLDHVLALVADGVISATPDGELLALSDSLIRAVGWTREDIVAQGWTNLVYRDPEARADVQRGIAALVRGVPSEGVVRTLARKDGTEARMAIWSRLVPDPAGGAPAMLGVMRDVTSEEEERRRVRRDEGLAQLGRVAGGIAHEYNNLLCAVMGHAELIEQTPGVSRDVVRRAETIVRSARRGAHLSSRLLAFTGTGTSRPQPVDVGQAVRQVADLYAPRLDSRVRLEVVVEPTPLAEVDPNQLQQALINLVVNGAEAMPGGGLLRVSTAFERLPDELRFRSATVPPVGTPMIRVRVQDQGPGFALEALSRLFEPFFTSKPEGHGMGLPAVRNVASVHGGAVGVHNEGGAVIDLWLPRSVRPELTLSRPSAEGRSQGVQVWIVDDQEAVLEFGRVSLEAHGFAVEAWPDAESVRASLARGALFPDLLVLDVQLVETDGIALWRELATFGVDCPVLWITGHTPETLQVPEGSGPVLQKPFTGADLVGAVERILRR